MTAKKKVEMTTYEIVKDGGRRNGGETLRLTVPNTWKVTYGMVHPGMKGGYGDAGYVLRFYEAENKQRAIFQHVESFRDVSLPLVKQVTTTLEQKAAEYDTDGNLVSEAVIKKDREWQEVE